MDEKKEALKCSCGETLHLHHDSMATVQRCILTYSCKSCGKKWEQTADGKLSEVIVQKENPCEGCYSYGCPSAMMRNCGRCENGSLRNCIF